MENDMVFQEQRLIWILRERKPFPSCAFRPAKVVAGSHVHTLG